MNNNTILVIHFMNPGAYPPLINVINCLIDKGYEISLVGSRCEESKSFKIHNNKQLDVSIIDGLIARNIYIKSFLLFIISLLKIILHKPILIYLSDPHSCVIGGMLNKIFNVKIIYHEHDTPMINNSNVLKKMRRYIISNADAIVVPNIKRLEKGITAPVFEVMNVPSVEDLQQMKSTFSEHNNYLKVYYHGSINKSRFPLMLITAVKKIRQKAELLVVGYETIGSQGYKSCLSKLSSKNNVHLEFKGPYSHKKCLDIATSQSVGICFYQGSDDINFKYMWGASNKIYDYLSAGLAILLEDTEEFREGFEGLEFPVVFVDSNCEQSIVDGLEKIDDLPVSSYANVQKKFIENWNYEYQFEPVVDFINSQVKE